jgi:hypothetical protein
MSAPKIKPARTAPIGPNTVTVLGSHWRAGPSWEGFDWSRAKLRSWSIRSFTDYHLAVPWAHANDRHEPVDKWCVYRVRLKRGWRSFVQGEDGGWMVSTAARRL